MRGSVIIALNWELFDERIGRGDEMVLLGGKRARSGGWIPV
jgi:hypothetical protein